METYNSIVDFENPGAGLYRKHVESAQYGCILCKHKEGSSFEKIDIGNDNLIKFFYSCKYCGNSTSQAFSLEEIRMMMKHASMGDTSDFYEAFLLPQWYPHLVSDYAKYRQYCRILQAPPKSRWRAAWEKLLTGRKML